MADFTDVLRKMKADLPGEINGIKEYAMLSKMADEMDEDCWAKMLKDMAWEEHTHAKHLMHILDKNHVSYTEYVPAYNDATKLLKDL